MKKLEKANLPAKAGDTDVDLIRLVKEKDALLKLIEARIKTNKKAKTGDAVFRKVQMKEKETKPRVEPVDVLELTRTASADAKRMGKDATIRMRRKRLRIKAKEGKWALQHLIHPLFTINNPARKQVRSEENHVDKSEAINSKATKCEANCQKAA